MEITFVKLIQFLNCIRGVFRTQSNIYNGALLQKKLAAKGRQLFLQKSSIVDIRLDSK